ncbi:MULTISPECIES: CDGSH iron-sulfur domain-containing protein [Pseudomonadaceae]|uniref:CDGSH iron-sulfur domain-containing protein n=1 Tax=Pseudomonadaceae TaxID=135621 RepID=UPI0030B998F2
MSGSTDDPAGPPLPAPGEEGGLPEVRQVEPGVRLLLCRCGHSPRLPDCPLDCRQGLAFQAERPRILLLCRCGRSRRLPWCDGSHAPETVGFKARWRRFWTGG